MPRNISLIQRFQNWRQARQQRAVMTHLSGYPDGMLKDMGILSVDPKAGAIETWSGERVEVFEPSPKNSPEKAAKTADIDGLNSWSSLQT